MNLQIDILEKDFKIKPDIVVAYIDQTDIGDENCRYKNRKKYVNGKLSVVKYLIDGEADISAQNDSGNTPLHVAENNNYNEVVNFLLETEFMDDFMKENAEFIKNAGHNLESTKVTVCTD